MLAHYNLFLAYRNGEGVDVDEAKATEHLQKAADLGDARAFFDMGKKYFRAGNQADSLAMFTKAKEAKHPDADKGIGLLQSSFTFGRGLQQRKVEKTNKTYTNPTITFTVRNGSDSNLLFACDLHSIDEKGNITPKSVEIPMTPIRERTSESLEMFPGVDLHETVQLYQYRVSYNRSEPAWTAFPLGNPIELWTPADSKKHRGPCFVVTVCMQDEMDPTVVAFRRFRDEVLEQYRLGRTFSNAYYRHGPALARWVSRHPRVRSALGTLFRITAKVLP
jgi:TPR repeat protein